MTEARCRRKFGARLDIHHIKRYFDSFDDSPANLVTLCRSCHARADGTTLKTGAIALV